MSRKSARRQSFYALQKRLRRYQREKRVLVSRLAVGFAISPRSGPEWLDVTCIGDTFPREIRVRI